MAPEHPFDIAMPAEEAFDHAYHLALEEVIRRMDDEKHKAPLEKLLQDKQ